MTATPARVDLGSGTYVGIVNLRTGLQALGHDVVVIQPRRPLPIRGYGFARLAFNWRLRADRLSGYDLVTGFDLDGWTIAQRVAAPYVAYLHGVIADEARFEQGSTRWSLALQARAECTNARRAARVLAPSEYSRRRIAELYGVESSQVRVVPPAFDAVRWRRVLAEMAVPHPPGRPTVLCVGRMYPRKNHAALLRAATLLARDLPTVEFRIAGDGPERARLEAQAVALGLGDTVRFLGQVQVGVLALEYASCDVFCLPSLQEGFGLVFAEAMVAGKPIVACDASSTPEVVTHVRNGYLVPPGDDQALANALSALLRDPEARRRMGNANRADAAVRFGVERAASQFVDAVRPLLPRPHPAGAALAPDARPASSVKGA